MWTPSITAGEPGVVGRSSLLFFGRSLGGLGEIAEVCEVCKDEFKLQEGESIFECCEKEEVCALFFWLYL